MKIKTILSILMVCCSPVMAFQSMHETVESELSVTKTDTEFLNAYKGLLKTYSKQHKQVMIATIFIYEHNDEPLSNEQIVDMVEVTLKNTKSSKEEIAMTAIAYVPLTSEEIQRVYTEVTGKVLETPACISCAKGGEKDTEKDTEKGRKEVVEPAEAKNPLDILITPLIPPIVTPPSSTEEFK